MLSADEYTHIMMRNSTVPEIANLAKEHLIIDDYWNDTSDNIQVMSQQGDVDETKAACKNGKEKTAKPTKRRLLSAAAESTEMRNLASPALTYNRDGVFAPSPVACFTRSDFTERANTSSEDEDATMQNDFKTNARQQEPPPVALQR